MKQDFEEITKDFFEVKCWKNIDLRMPLPPTYFEPRRQHSTLIMIVLLFWIEK